MDNNNLLQILLSGIMPELKEFVKAEIQAAMEAAPPPAATERPLSQKELCNFLGITEQTIIRLKKKGKVPFMNIGSAVRYNVNDVLKAIEKKK